MKGFFFFLTLKPNCSLKLSERQRRLCFSGCVPGIFPCDLLFILPGREAKQLSSSEIRRDETSPRSASRSPPLSHASSPACFGWWRPDWVARSRWRFLIVRCSTIIPFRRSGASQLCDRLINQLRGDAAGLLDHLCYGSINGIIVRVRW